LTNFQNASTGTLVFVAI